MRVIYGKVMYCDRSYFRDMKCESEIMKIAVIIIIINNIAHSASLAMYPLFSPPLALPLRIQ